MFSDNYVIERLILFAIIFTLLLPIFALLNYFSKRQQAAKEKVRADKKQAEQARLEVEEPWPDDLPPLEEFARQTLEKTGLPSTLYVTDPTLRPTDSTATWIGKVVAGLPGEPWPTHEGRPMFGVCQLNLTEAPYVPHSLKEFSLICFFGIGDKKEPEYIMPNWGGGWEIRAYRPDQELVPYTDPPAPPTDWKPCGAHARLFTDYYSNISVVISDSHPQLARHWVDKVDNYVYTVLRPELNKAQELPHEAEWGTKLGGWPAPIQQDIELPLAFQLGCENDVGIFWGDSGCVYVWRTESGEWEVDESCY